MSRILIVEDDEDIAELERDYLEASGFDTALAQDGRKGLSLALGGGFDLVILDIMLPGEDGLSVCRSIRERSGIPVIMVTARGEDIDVIRGLGIGANDYVTKPFSPSVRAVPPQQPPRQTNPRQMTLFLVTCASVPPRTP